MTEKIEFLISKSDLDYTCVQMNLSAESNRQCVNALPRINFSVCFRFKKKVYGLADTLATFQEKTDRALQFCTSTWLVFGTRRRLTNI